MSKSVLDHVAPIATHTAAVARDPVDPRPSSAASELDYLLAADGPGLTPEHRQTGAALERRWLSLGPEQLARVRALVLGEVGQGDD
jgi:hypothetical protein